MQILCQKKNWGSVLIMSWSFIWKRKMMINQVWKAHKTFLTDFLLSVKSNLWWHQFCLTLHCDWSRKVTQFAQPIKCKTKINDNLARFPMLSVVSLFLLWVVIGSLGYFPFFWLTINKHSQICTHWLSGRAAVKSALFQAQLTSVNNHFIIWSWRLENLFEPNWSALTQISNKGAFWATIKKNQTIKTFPLFLWVRKKNHEKHNFISHFLERSTLWNAFPGWSVI